MLVKFFVFKLKLTIGTLLHVISLANIAKAGFVLQNTAPKPDPSASRVSHTEITGSQVTACGYECSGFCEHIA